MPVTRAQAATSTHGWMRACWQATPSLRYTTTRRSTRSRGNPVTRKGFIARIRLEEIGKGSIHPHEKTLAGPKADRLRLFTACRANLSCVFSLYAEPVQGQGGQQTVTQALDNAATGAPLIEVPDDDGIMHRVWRVTDPNVIESVTNGMKARDLFIADGHHRYETALKYRDVMNEGIDSPTGDEPHNFVMMYLSNMLDAGMTVFPTHRVVHGLEGLDAMKLVSTLEEYFNVERLAFDATTEAAVRAEFYAKVEQGGQGGVCAMGLFIRGEDTYFVLTLKSNEVMEQAFGTSIPDVFKDLDVTVLHSLVLSKVLGLTTESQERQENLFYVKSSDATLDKARDSDKSASLYPERYEGRADKGGG